jgi:hypothetical protein
MHRSALQLHISGKRVRTPLAVRGSRKRLRGRMVDGGGLGEVGDAAEDGLIEGFGGGMNSRAGSIVRSY